MLFDLIIVGAGPAGVTASIYAKNAGLNFLLIESELIGGKLNEIDEICNYTGFDRVKGSELANKLTQHINGVNLIFDKIIKISRDNNGNKIAIGALSQYMAKNVLIAIGTRPKELGLHIDKKYLSYCELCDGALCVYQNVVVVGGGNSAFSCALYLSNICKHIHIAVRKERPIADFYLVNKVSKKHNVKIMYNTEIERVSGERVYFTNGVIVSAFKIFVKIGEQPNKIETNLGEQDGVFTTGSCSGIYPNQIITAESDAITTFVTKILIRNKV